MNVERLSQIALVAGYLRAASDNTSIVKKDIRPEVTKKIRELDKMFFEELFGSDKVKEDLAKLKSDLEQVQTGFVKYGDAPVDPERPVFKTRKKVEPKATPKAEEPKVEEPKVEEPKEEPKPKKAPKGKLAQSLTDEDKAMLQESLAKAKASMKKD